MHRRHKSTGTLLSLMVTLMATVALVTGCKDRAVGSGSDATPGPDGAVIPDGAVGPDASPGCAAPRLSMGFVWGTHVQPSHPTLEPDVDDYEVAGTLAYKGPITVPLATLPDFDRELQIEHADGQITMVQYYLPPGVTLPVEVGAPYTLWLRHRWGFDGYATGVIITRPTSGLPPTLFVGDTGSYGRAYTPEDQAINPFKVYVEPRPECPAEPDPECGGQILADQLRIQWALNSIPPEVQLVQATEGTLNVFGDVWRVLNLASSHVDQPCADAPGEEVSYLMILTAALPQTCDPARLYWWDEPYGIEVGTFCDTISLCADVATGVPLIEQISPNINCGEPEPPCGAGEVTCTYPMTTVDQALYDELCEITVLPDPPDRITCRVYL